MEHVVIHDPDAGEVHVWRDGHGFNEVVASASALFAFISFGGGEPMAVNPDRTVGCQSGGQCAMCLAYRKHLELRDG